MHLTMLAVEGTGQMKLGQCLPVKKTGYNCENDCSSDLDCPGFQKCCADECGHRCRFPHVATG